jgi:myo-inositol-1(or 4)-monophosphatase
MDAFASVARTAVEEAGRQLRAAFRGSKRVDYKSPVDLVTETDRDVEALIVDRLRHAFPDHLIVAEEASSGATLSPPAVGHYVWYLDPLDGTTNFAHDFPHFAVSLALADGAQLLFGIVCDPLRDETFVAHRGGGATLNGEPIRVSVADDLDHALLATGLPYDRRTHVDFYLSFMADFIRRTRDVRRAGSAALDLCYVACGRFDGFWEWKLRPWDTAAGALIVREAGGAVSDFHGGPFDLYGEQTLASNGRVHAAMTEVLTARLRRTSD